MWQATMPVMSQIQLVLCINVIWTTTIRCFISVRFSIPSVFSSTPPFYSLDCRENLRTAPDPAHHPRKRHPPPTNVAYLWAANMSYPNRLACLELCSPRATVENSLGYTVRPSVDYTTDICLPNIKRMFTAEFNFHHNLPIMYALKLSTE